MSGNTTQDPVPGSPDPGKHNPSPRRNWTIAGLAAVLFCVLFLLGLTLLPAATFREKALIIGACLTLSGAGAAGAGAVRSPRRLATAAVAGGAAVICLGALSVAAKGSPSDQRSASSGASMISPPVGQTAKPSRVSPTTASAPPSGSATPSGSPTLSAAPPATPTASAQGTHLYLSTLTGSAPFGSTGPESGGWRMNRTLYTHSLGFPDGCSDAVDETYTIPAGYASFAAEVGVADGSSAEDQGTVLTFEFDGVSNSSGGSSQTLGTVSTQIGQPTSVNIDIRSYNQITIMITEGCLEGSVAVVGNARFVPSS